MTGVMRHVHLEAQSAVLERIAGIVQFYHIYCYFGVLGRQPKLRSLIRQINQAI